jgi:predicted nucleic acid-binding protein
VVPWQAAGEFLNWLRRSEAAGRISAPDVESYFRNTLAPFPLALPTANIFPKYFDLFSRFSLSHWDAMLLAACHEAGVTTVYSEDMDTVTDYDGLRIVNPFA